ncbi:MAG: hypothetical protein H6983_10620 [Ectothiorhodospiraceae bacterium]|nr:hypothetical protein [Chromatiales bacterium]MCP5154610.1 hypothetical protein [Ectothiorhodospiraceae bacterium]
MRLRHVLMVVCLSLSANLAAADYPATLARVDELVAKSTDLDESTKKMVEELRAEAEKESAAGKEGKAMDALNQALLLLGAFN